MGVTALSQLNYAALYVELTTSKPADLG